jgi:hypothetical protein
MAPHWARDAIAADFRAIAHDVAHGVSPNRASRADSIWNVWLAFCTTISAPPHFDGIVDPIPTLLLFAHRFRYGQISPSGTIVRSRTVEDALRAVGQKMAFLGKKDPRLTPAGLPDLRLTRLLSRYKKDDTPPWRVKPVPIQVVDAATSVGLLSTEASGLAIADMIILAFFFLLRPGEYAYSSSPESTPFRICDVHLLIGQRRLNWRACSDEELHAITFVALEFTSQKNGVRGELIGLSRSGSPTLCPVQAIIRRMQHFRHLSAPSDTPLYTFYNGHAWHHVTPSIITSTLRSAVATIGAPLGIDDPSDISARSLRSGGAMALLCAEVDTDKIRLLGRWRSDEMLRYLHIQAYPLTATFANQMLLHGNFALLPNNPLHRLPPIPVP